MEIRRARHEDIGMILDYMEDYHKDSNLNDIAFHRQSSFRIVQYYIDSRDSYPLIATDGEKIGGLLFGSIEPFFFNSKKGYATDLMFFSKGFGPQLWKKFRDWAFDMGADRIIMGVSSGDPRAGQLLEALGMKQTGGMYVLRQESS